MKEGLHSRLIYISVVTTALVILTGAAGAVRRAHTIDTLFIREGRAVGLSPALLSAVAWKESRYDPAALGDAGEIGLMQITPGAASDWAKAGGRANPTADELWHPAVNVEIGAWYLARAHRHWKDKKAKRPMQAALAEYNAGRSNAAQWEAASEAEGRPFLECVTIESTQRYIRDILAR